MRNGPTGRARRTAPPADPDSIAIQALTFIADHPDHAERFLALTGIGSGDLRRSAAGPGFLLGVMDHLASDEPLLLLVAEELCLPPEAIVEARERMARR